MYVIGTVNPTSQRIDTPSKILITKKVLDVNELAWFTINSKITGYLYIDTGEPQTKVGYQGTISFRDTTSTWNNQKVWYRMAFMGVPSNWNCESYPNSKTYRPYGARYLLKIQWEDVTQHTNVNTYSQLVYVKYQSR